MTAADPWFVCKQIPFKMMPKFLLEAPYREMLKDSAVILYTYMYDLSRLSYQNSRKEKAWVNEKGEVFIRCSLDKVQEVLRCSREKALNEVRSLEKAVLIKRISHGKGRPMDIVLLEPAVGKADSVEFEKPTPQSSENQPGKVRKSNRNHNHAEETELPISIDPLVTHARSEVEEDVKENLCFDILMGEASLDHNSLKGIVKVIVDAVCSKRQVLKISGHEYEIEEVRRTLYALDDMDIRYVLDKIKDMNEPIKYFSGFCLAKLMEAKYASESYYESKVRKDMAAGKL